MFYRTKQFPRSIFKIVFKHTFQTISKFLFLRGWMSAVSGVSVFVNAVSVRSTDDRYNVGADGDVRTAHCHAHF